MKQENIKMESKSVFPLLMSMSLPPMLSMLIQSLYNIVDSMFVAQIGTDSLTAVSLAFPIQSIIVAFAVGIGVGVNSFISRKLGEKNQAEANSAIVHGMILAFIFTIVFTIGGLLLLKPFFSMFTQDVNIMKDAIDYTSVVLLFSFTSFFHILIEKVFQSTGKMIFPMVIQIIGALINIILDPIFIFGWFGVPAMGVRGAAIATIIGQFTAMMISLYILVKKEHDVALDLKNFKYSSQMMKDILSIGIPNSMMNALPSFLTMGLNGILVTFSNAAVSVFGIYFKLQTFVFMPANGLSQGAMPLLGYSYGANKKERFHETMKYNVLVTFFIMSVGVIIFNLFPVQLLKIFNADAEMMQIGVSTLRLISISFIPATIGYSLPTLFQAIGKGSESLIVFVLRQFIVTLPLSVVLSRVIGLNGICIAFIVAEVIGAFVSIAIYRNMSKDTLILQTQQ